LTGWYFRGFGNAFPNTVHFNVPDPPPCKRVRQVELTGCDGPLSLALFKFIERFFPHADHLYISIECRLEKFDWKLLPHFPKMTTVSMGVYYRNSDDFNYDPLDAASFRALFSLVPNLRVFQTSIAFLEEYQTVLRVDQQLREVFERIEVVQMTKNDNRQMEEFLHSFFPNAKLRFDYQLYQFL